MKRLIILIVAILLIPAVAFAAELPDYQKDGKVIRTFSCDSGKTTVNVVYPNDDKKEWIIIEFNLSSGDVLAYSYYDQGTLYAKRAGQTTMSAVSEKEFNELLKTNAPEAYKADQKQPNADCKLK